MKMAMNGSAMGPHGLIFDEDGAIYKLSGAPRRPPDAI